MIFYSLDSSLHLAYYNTATRRWTTILAPAIVDPWKHTVSTLTKTFGYYVVVQGQRTNNSQQRTESQDFPLLAGEGQPARGEAMGEVFSSVLGEEISLPTPIPTPELQETGQVVFPQNLPFDTTQGKQQTTQNDTSGSPTPTPATTILNFIVKTMLRKMGW